MTLQQWLQDPSDYEIGRKLYEQYGRNNNLKKLFKNGRLKDKLIYELCKVLVESGNVVIGVPGVTIGEPDFQLLPFVLNSSESEIRVSESQTEDSERKDPLPEGIEFDSLLSGMKEEPLDNPILDDINEQLTPLYRKRTILHSQLEAFPNDEERKAAAYGILDYTEQIEKLLDTKNYVEQHGTLPDQRPAHTKTVLTDKYEMHVRVKNLASYISKHQSNPKKAAKVKAWKEEKELLEKQLE
jgi:hypothetical protein